MRVHCTKSEVCKVLLIYNEMKMFLFFWWRDGMDTYMGYNNNMPYESVGILIYMLYNLSCVSIYRVAQKKRNSRFFSTLLSSTVIFLHLG